MNYEREFVQKIEGRGELYRFRDLRFGYRFVLVDGLKERFFDNQKEVQEYKDRMGIKS